MRIEDVDKTRLSKACDKELLILKLRFTQAWDRNIKNKSPIVVSDLSRNRFLKSYKLLLDEIGTRKLELSTSAIDKATFKKAMTTAKFGIDVSDFEDIVVAPDCIAIGTDLIDDVAAFVKQKQEDLLEEVLDKYAEEHDHAYIPLYDLVLKAKQNTAIIEVSKPYPNEHSARLQDPSKFDSKSFRRTSGGIIYGSKKVPSTISIIWGKPKGKTKPGDPPVAQALRFPVKNWTSPKAKKWLADNEIEFTLFEPAKKVSKKLKKKEEKTLDRFISVYPIDKADKDEHIICGVVYEPDVEDTQGDKANELEIRKAAYQFMEQVQTFKVMHKGKKVKVKVLESYVAPTDFTVASQPIKKGSWVLTVRVLDKKIWKAVKDGELTGFSMAGYAKTA